MVAEGMAWAYNDVAIEREHSAWLSAFGFNFE
jgi:hypothetical protein